MPQHEKLSSEWPGFMSITLNSYNHQILLAIGYLRMPEEGEDCLERSLERLIFLPKPKV